MMNPIPNIGLVKTSGMMFSFFVSNIKSAISLQIWRGVKYSYLFNLRQVTPLIASENDRILGSYHHRKHAHHKLGMLLLLLRFF